MSNWTHAICLDCWDDLFPDRDPFRVLQAPTEACCFCNATTMSGLYVRVDPADPRLVCQGRNHD